MMTKIAILVTAIMLICSVVVYADYTSSKLDNSWRWRPVSGEPEFYEVWKSLGETWEKVGQAPHKLVEGYIKFTVVSLRDEAYQLRVRAGDSDGNFGKYSFVSDVLRIDTKPGKPELETKDE